MLYKVKTLIPAIVFRHLCLKTRTHIGVFVSTVFLLMLAMSNAAFAVESVVVAAADATVASSTKPAWPNRAIKYVVPFPPGGLADSMARVISNPMSAALQQSIIIENRPGGNAMIGYQSVAETPADGNTWLAVTLAHAINQSLFPNKWAPIERAFTPVVMLGASPLVVVVNPNVSATTMTELRALAKAAVAKSKPLLAGSSGNGTPPHLGLALLEGAFETDIVHIVYKGGAPSVMDLLAHHVDLIVANLPEVLAHINAGKLRALAVTSAKRSPFLPNVPTSAEAGFPSVAIENWTGIMVAANTPKPIVAQIAREAIAALATTETKMRFETLGFTPFVLTGDALSQFINNEVYRWGKIVRDRKIQAE
jgi:tripartite-type tricarboxylate transporter receptor subunit TctC